LGFWFIGFDVLAAGDVDILAHFAPPPNPIRAAMTLIGSRL
jgi:hypothetical protein